jgi:adenine-specific DNA-methyltransferase
MSKNIDPPYNTGAKDWKYNNDYVDSSDSYRHSKWLSMMEKRLKLAKKLLNPKDGVLIVAIDDYEFAHLTVLLEELFSEYDCNTIVVNHHPQGGSADNVARTHEYAIFVTPKGKKVIFGNKSEDIEEKWSLMRGGTNERNLRIGRPKSFYAIYINKSTLKIEGVGPELEANESYDLNETPNDCIAMYPIGKDGKERVWRYTRSSMIQHIHNGDIVCTPNLSLQVIKRRDTKYESVVSVWTDTKYNAGTSGTAILQQIFYPNNRFPYPKSLYSVLDCIKYSTLHKPNALIVDFFAGSGTTLHAVNLLNVEDGGQRRCILVTNNEVSDKEAKKLKKDGFKPGDLEWERLGIARYVTWPRTLCSIKGEDINGEPLKGNYLESDRPMADGFQSNAIYFKLGFLDKTSIALGRQFKELLSVLWMKAGAIGACPQLEGEDIPKMLILPDNHFAVLTDEKDFPEFFEQVKAAANIETVFIVTDSEAGYREMAAKLQVKTSYQLYRDYLDNFRINTGRK